jgi:16S rRNA (adenine1518-N6/adenine1519-N6)-dimethyltransferase
MSKHIPRKRFGQNFLQDTRVIGAIVDAIRPEPGEAIVEIGPGLGALTYPLLERAGKLHVVEIDRDIIARLKNEISPDKLTIHEGDALAFDFGSIAPKMKIVGNLPYNISTPLLFHLADYAEQVVEMHFMLQKEVVERMVAEPGTADYGRLTVMLQYRFYMENLFIVPGDAFWPPPKVESAVVRMIPAAGAHGVAQNEVQFGEVVAQAFAQRRKTLRNNLKGLFSDEEFAALEIDPALRPENLTVAQYVKLANALAGR